MEALIALLFVEPFLSSVDLLSLSFKNIKEAFIHMHVSLIDDTSILKISNGCQMSHKKIPNESIFMRGIFYFYFLL